MPIKLNSYSPFYLLAFWSLLLLANFVPTIPQPAVIIGYLWKVEFAFAGLIFVTLLIALKFPQREYNAPKVSKRELYRIILPVIAFTVWSGFSVIWAQSGRNALHHTLLWACYALFYILIRQIVARPKLLDISLKVAATVIAILGSLCLIQYLTTDYQNSAAVSLRYSKYAEVMAALLPLFIVSAIGAKNKHSFFFTTASTLGWLGIILSLGRTQFVSSLVGIFVLIVLVSIKSANKISLKKTFICGAFFVSIIAFSQISWTSDEAKQSTINRFSGDGQSQSSLQIRLLYWEIALESFRQHPFAGSGADNFSDDYNAARKKFADKNTGNSKINLYSEILPERAHNEYLQILAELGIVGGLIFGWLLCGIGSFLFALRGKTVSLLSLASLAGMAAFLVSSLASSYSFRVPANGVCFFFLLAIAADGIFKNRALAAESERKYDFDFLKLKPALIGCGLLIGGAMLIFSAVRGISLMYLQAALESSEKIEAEINYQKAIAWDDQEPLFKYYYGVHLYNDKRADEAIPQIRFAVDRGISTSINYFSLAAAQTVARQNVEAEKTFAEALRVFPRSVFLRTAYSAFLKENNRDAEAETEFQKALQTDRQQALSWQIAHREGTEKLTKAGMSDRELLPAMSLQPNDAVYALIGFQLQNNPSLLQRKF